MYAPITAIYLDVEETYVNWVEPTLRVLGFDPAAVYERWDALEPRPWNLFDVIDYDTALAWTLIDEQGPEFWATLRPFPWARELIAACREVAPVTLLTSPSMHPNSYAGKALWMRRSFGEDFHDYAFTRVKHRFAHAGAVLIDDSPHNCRAFTTRSDGNPTPGRAVLFPGVGNELHYVPGTQRVAHVVDSLRRLQG